MPTFRSATFNMVFGGATTTSLNKPPGSATGDLAVSGLGASSGFYNSGDSDNRLSVTGFTTIQEILTGSNPIVGLYLRKLDGSEGSTFTCNFDGGSNRFMWCALIEAGTWNDTGVLADALEAYAMLFDSGGDASVTAPDITTTSGALSLACWAGDVDPGWTAPSVSPTWTERFDTAGSAFGSGMLATRSPSAGAQGAQVATASSGLGGVGAAGWHLSFAPGGAPPAPTSRGWRRRPSGLIYR